MVKISQLQNMRANSNINQHIKFFIGMLAKKVHIIKVCKWRVSKFGVRKVGLTCISSLDTPTQQHCRQRDANKNVGRIAIDIDHCWLKLWCLICTVLSKLQYLTYWIYYTRQLLIYTLEVHKVSTHLYN